MIETNPTPTRSKEFDTHKDTSLFGANPKGKQPTVDTLNQPSMSFAYLSGVNLGGYDSRSHFSVLDTLLEIDIGEDEDVQVIRERVQAHEKPKEDKTKK